MTNQFGNLCVETKKVAGCWVPTGEAEASEVPTAPPDATHWVRYEAKVSKIASAQAPDKGNGKGKFRKGKCLFDLKKPRELCSPADKSPVQPPRTTAAAITGSTATVRNQSLLCYKVKLSTKVKSTDAATLGGLQVGDKITQQKYAKRQRKQGTQVNTFPGNQFPRPVAVDTSKADQVCIPTDVLSVSDL